MKKLGIYFLKKVKKVMLPANEKKQESIALLGMIVTKFLRRRCVFYVQEDKVSPSHVQSTVALREMPASMKRIRSKTAEKKWQHRFSHYGLLLFFFRRSKAANSAVRGRI